MATVKPKSCREVLMTLFDELEIEAKDKKGLTERQVAETRERWLREGDYGKR